MEAMLVFNIGLAHGWSGARGGRARRGRASAPLALRLGIRTSVGNSGSGHSDHCHSRGATSLERAPFSRRASRSIASALGEPGARRLGVTRLEGERREVGERVRDAGCVVQASRRWSGSPRTWRRASRSPHRASRRVTSEWPDASFRRSVQSPTSARSPALLEFRSASSSSPLPASATSDVENEHGLH